MSAITVAFYNIRRGRGMDGRVDVGRVARTIQEWGADAVVLSEVERRWRREVAGDQPWRLAAATGMRGVFCAAIAIGGYRFGNLLLTPHEVAEERCVRLGRGGGIEPRGVVGAKLIAGDATWWVVGAHLDHSRRGRRAQAVELARFLGTLDAPAVLAGDLNADLDAPELAPVAAWGSGGAARGDDGAPLPTFPSDRPLRQIDHILAGPGCAIMPGKVMRVPFSDHLPIVAAVSQQESSP